MSRALWASKVPTNINPLSHNGFRLNIDKIPELDFFCQEINIPNLTLGQYNFDTPLSKTPIPGDKLEFGDFEVQFLIDEDMKNYKSIWDWMIGLGFPRNHTDYSNFIERSRTNGIRQNAAVTAATSDATLQILTNNSNGNKIISFRGLFPIGLGGLQFSAVDQDVNYLIGRATFAFDYFEFV